MRRNSETKRKDTKDEEERNTINFRWSLDVRSFMKINSRFCACVRVCMGE